MCWIYLRYFWYIWSICTFTCHVFIVHWSLSPWVQLKNINIEWRPTFYHPNLKICWMLKGASSFVDQNRKVPLSLSISGSLILPSAPEFRVDREAGSMFRKFMRRNSSSIWSGAALTVKFNPSKRSNSTADHIFLGTDVDVRFLLCQQIPLKDQKQQWLMFFQLCLWLLAHLLPSKT